jgi:MSHA pilin protein MshC
LRQPVSIAEGVVKSGTVGAVPARSFPVSLSTPAGGVCRQRGFTLVELIVVILVSAILAVAVGARLVSRSGFEARGYDDRAQALVRYAQKAAIAQRRPVLVFLDGSALSACFDDDGDGDCTDPGEAPVQDPGSGGPLAIVPPAGVAFALAPSAFSFDGLGRPVPAGQYTVSVSVSGEGARNFTIERETGHVHP